VFGLDRRDGKARRLSSLGVADTKSIGQDLQLNRVDPLPTLLLRARSSALGFGGAGCQRIGGVGQGAANEDSDNNAHYHYQNTKSKSCREAIIVRRMHLAWSFLRLL
jgi:hypothetical protein